VYIKELYDMEYGILTLIFLDVAKFTALTRVSLLVSNKLPLSAVLWY
jgi:hypothetical protein